MTSRPGQVPDEPPGLAPGQLGDVGVLLLGQHRAAGGVGVGERAEPELLGRPQHDLLAHPGEVHAEQREVEQGLGHEVPVGHRVEGVLEPAVEAEVLGHEVRVERERGAGQRAGARAGETSIRSTVATSRSTSRASAQPWASRWWASSTGWARCRWV